MTGTWIELRDNTQESSTTGADGRENNNLLNMSFLKYCFCNKRNICLRVYYRAPAHWHNAFISLQAKCLQRFTSDQTKDGLSAAVKKMLSSLSCTSCSVIRIFHSFDLWAGQLRAKFYLVQYLISLNQSVRLHMTSVSNLDWQVKMEL